MTCLQQLHPCRQTGTEKHRSRPVIPNLDKLLAILFLGLLISLLGGCGGRSNPAPPQMALEIKPAATANKGQVFYMVVRSTNEKQYLTATYADITGLVFADPPDPSVLGAFPVFPGKPQTLNVAQPGQNPVAFYFLFSGPSDHWRHLVDQPLAAGYEIRIEGDTVVVAGKKSFWSFF